MFRPPFFVPDPGTAVPQKQPKNRLPEEQPRRPDWLLIFMSILFLLTLLLLWIVDIPQTVH